MPLLLTRSNATLPHAPQKLVVIGGTVETARRASVSAWNGFIDCAWSSLSLLSDVGAHPTYVTPAAFFLTAHFSQEDYPYDWCVFSNSARLAYSRNSTPSSPAGSCTGSPRSVPSSFPGFGISLAQPTTPTQQPAWGRSREFDITTRSVSRHGLTQKTTGDLEDDEEEEESGEFQQGNGRRRRGERPLPRPGSAATDQNSD